ncbi:unnamed protein product [Ectocarpus sp. 8 AP-2014]
MALCWTNAVSCGSETRASSCRATTRSPTPPRPSLCPLRRYMHIIFLSFRMVRRTCRFCFGSVAMVYATSIDGSVVHATATRTPPGDLEDRTIDPVSLTRRTLLEANPRCMSKVEGLRAEIVEEREEAEKAAIEGRGLKKSKMVTVLGFLPSESTAFVGDERGSTRLRTWGRRRSPSRTRETWRPRWTDPSSFGSPGLPGSGFARKTPRTRSV